MSARAPLRVLAFMDARVLTGPAKNLIAFASRARASVERPVEVTIATYERSDGKPNQFIEAASQAGLHTEVICERARFDYRVIPEIRRLVREIQPDIIQTHAVKSHFLTLLTGAWKKTAWIAFHHGYTATDWKDKTYNRLDRFSLRQPRKVVTVCRPFARELHDQGVPAERIAIIHNSIQPFTAPFEDEIRRTRSEFHLPVEVPVILAVGRLSREKGHLDLVEAAGAIRNTHPGLRFRVAIAGEGPERAVLEQRIQALGLSGTIVLCGHQADVRPFYALASVVALPSHSEGSPNVLLEAMAAGIPVVATSVGGVPEIATTDVTALLVAREDKTGLARAIARLLQDRQFAARIAAAGRDDVLRRFTPDVHLRSIVTLYDQVLGSPVE